MCSSDLRALARLKAHKYFDYHVDERGKLQWSPKKELIDAERQLDGWYVLHTNLSAEQVVRKSLEIAADLCIYTNRNIVIETL